MLVASLVTLPGLFMALRRNRPLASPCAVWLVVSYALGAYALVPSILYRLGCPEAVYTSPLMNVFLFHPFIRSLRPGGKIIGAATICFWFTLQYVVLIAAVCYRRISIKRAARPSGRT